MSIKFLVLGGGVFWVFGGGGSADFIFMGARIFLSEGSLRPLNPRAGKEDLLKNCVQETYLVQE